MNKIPTYVIIIRTIIYVAFVCLIAFDFQWWPRILGAGEINSLVIGIGTTIIAAQFGRSYVFLHK